MNLDKINQLKSEHREAIATAEFTKKQLEAAKNVERLRFSRELWERHVDQRIWEILGTPSMFLPGNDNTNNYRVPQSLPPSPCSEFNGSGWFFIPGSLPVMINYGPYHFRDSYCDVKADGRRMFYRLHVDNYVISRGDRRGQLQRQFDSGSGLVVNTTYVEADKLLAGLAWVLTQAEDRFRNQRRELLQTTPGGPPPFRHEQSNGIKVPWYPEEQFMIEQVWGIVPKTFRVQMTVDVTVPDMVDAQNLATTALSVSGGHLVGWQFSEVPKGAPQSGVTITI